jgi:diguanylate cyclase
MHQASGAPPSPRRIHWTVPVNYRIRAVSFATLFVSIVLHGWGKAYSPVFWILVALQLLVYPHVAFWIALHSSNPHRAEVRNLTLDCLWFGLLVAALQFPLWIAFTVYLAGTHNLTLSTGSRGLAVSQVAFFGGVVAAGSLLGWHASLATAWPATVMCLVTTTILMVAIAITGARRNQVLRETRRALRQSEQALKDQLGEIQALQSTLEQQATLDPLTGLYNRRYLETAFGRELSRCKREQTPLAVIMIDVDHFKRVNDTYGHAGGDEVLKKLATLLSECVRATDVACRYGGEEFLLLLPGMSPNMAVTRADAWRAAFARCSVPVGGAWVRATISMGISTYPQHGETADELARSADVALYRAKAAGRNQVVMYSLEEDGPGGLSS